MSATGRLLSVETRFNPDGTRKIILWDVFRARFVVCASVANAERLREQIQRGREPFWFPARSLSVSV